MKAVLYAVSITLLISQSAFGLNLGDFKKTIEKVKKAQEQVKQINDQLEQFSGEVVIDDVSRPWYFKMDWFDASACSKIYYQVNNSKPVFLAEFVGKPPVGAPIKISGLKRGDRVKFLVKTHWYGWHGPVYSTNKKFFKSWKKGAHLYYFQFEDAAGGDMAYNDGAFYFYEEGEGPPQNKLIAIKEYDTYKTPSGILFKGKLKVMEKGHVNSRILIKDSNWQDYKVIDNSFDADKADEYQFSYTLKEPLKGPMFTSIWNVSLQGERDSRVRALKYCIEKINNSVKENRKTVFHYSFDKCSAKDDSGNGFDGVVVGAPSCIRGIKGKAILLSHPNSDYITLDKSFSLQDFTFSFWIKLNKKAGDFNMFIEGANKEQDNAFSSSWRNSDNSVELCIANDCWYSKPINLLDGKFHNLTYVRKGRYTKLYIDGKLFYTFNSGLKPVNVEFLVIGEDQDCLGGCFEKNQYLFGTVDEVLLTNYPMTEEEVRRIYETLSNSSEELQSSPIFGSSKENPFFFVGKVYLLPEGTSSLPEFSKLKPKGRIYTPVLNVPPKNFSEGFPGVTDRFEWFAIDYKGKIFVPETRAYTFSLLSDDGSRLIIDGRVVIDNDGIHPPVEKRGTVKLRKGYHTIEVQYFQGPRYQVALVLSILENGKKVPFDIRNFSPAVINEGNCKTKITIGAGILFDFNSYQLKPEAMKILDTVIEFLKERKFSKLIVEGYTDNVGSKNYNLKLSKERAQAVENYLIAKGIPSNRIEIIGYGEENPIFPNDTPEHRARNRRVEIKVLKECYRGK